jgi:hypothetical protein
MSIEVEDDHTRDARSTDLVIDMLERDYQEQVKREHSAFRMMQFTTGCAILSMASPVKIFAFPAVLFAGASFFAWGNALIQGNQVQQQQKHVHREFMKRCDTRISEWNQQQQRS